MSNYDRIAACAMGYAQAQASQDLENLVSVEAALAARVNLAQCLIGAGWTPPPDAIEGLERDQAALGLAPGSIEAHARTHQSNPRATAVEG